MIYSIDHKSKNSIDLVILKEIRIFELFQI